MLSKNQSFWQTVGQIALFFSGIPYSSSTLLSESSSVDTYILVVELLVVQPLISSLTSLLVIHWHILNYNFNVKPFWMIRTRMMMKTRMITDLKVFNVGKVIRKVFFRCWLDPEKAWMHFFLLVYGLTNKSKLLNEVFSWRVRGKIFFSHKWLLEII